MYGNCIEDKYFYCGEHIKLHIESTNQLNDTLIIPDWFCAEFVNTRFPGIRLVCKNEKCIKERERHEKH